LLIAGVVQTERLGLTARPAHRGDARLRFYGCDSPAPAVDPIKLAAIAGGLDAVAGLEIEWLGGEDLGLACTPLA
jgi:hypothetical protein